MPKKMFPIHVFRRTTGKLVATYPAPAGETLSFEVANDSDADLEISLGDFKKVNSRDPGDKDPVQTQIPATVAAAKKGVVLITIKPKGNVVDGVRYKFSIFGKEEGKRSRQVLQDPELEIQEF